MWESTFFVDFQGLWEERETASCFPRFPSGRHFHRGGAVGFWDVIRPIDSPRVLLVSALVAVRLDLWFMLKILLCLHGSECVAEPFVLDDGGVTDTLVFAEDAIGKRIAFPANLERSIAEVINLDIL